MAGYLDERVCTDAWIGVDLDGTLAEYNGWQGEDHVGKPIPKMVERVIDWRTRGQEVRIFTARVSGGRRDFALPTIEQWCKDNLGEVLPVTNEKDYGMIELWDDRVVQVEMNTGQIIGTSTRGL